MASISPLSASQLDFIENKVTFNFLKQFGTATGFNEFCKVAVKAGALKSCRDGAKKNKMAYATYLYNAEGLWAKLLEGYKNLDSFTKAGMAHQVEKGKGLSTSAKEALQKGAVAGSCIAGDYTVSELKTIAMDLDSTLKRKDLEGIRKAELCALVDGLMKQQEMDAAGFWKLGAGKGEVAWEKYPLKEKVAGEALRRRYLKEFGLLPEKDKAKLFATLLKGDVPPYMQVDTSKIEKEGLA